MSLRKKPTPAPIACAPSDRPARSMFSAAVARRGLPTVAALLSACAALACTEARELVSADPESHVTGLGKAKFAPPDPTQGLPGFGGDEPALAPPDDPPTVKGEMPAVKPVKPTPLPPHAAGGAKAIVPPPIATPPKTAIPPVAKHPKLGGDVVAVDPSI